ncbi:MAG: GIY-YIG nuclease family protein [Candidatus Omnitrophica bacterium]|nr:GIY-YIG nuclease family protein [Candidatus Omnitrophota bacterium]
MPFIYVLKSKHNGKRYVGYTSKNVRIRLKEHNSGNTRWTRLNRPFDLLHYEEFSNIKEAKQREKFLKSGQGRKFLDNLFPGSSIGRAVGC